MGSLAVGMLVNKFKQIKYGAPTLKMSTETTHGVKATIDGHTLHILLRQTQHAIVIQYYYQVSTNNAQQDMAAKDPQTVPCTTHIELLRDFKKRKYKIEAERKQMEKQEIICKIRSITAVNRLSRYSNY